VGDPERISILKKYLDVVHFEIKHREFVTVTGEFAGQALSIVSTGIGTDNIDIVFSEIDALFNIHLETKTAKDEVTPLQFIRLGTSGGLHPDIAVGDVVLSGYAVGLDSLLHYYANNSTIRIESLEAQVNQITQLTSYAVPGSSSLLHHFSSLGQKGITITCPGFYAPQGRNLRLQAAIPQFLDQLSDVQHEGLSVTNFEMETSGIYGMAALMGHKAISINGVLANRQRGEFAPNPKKVVESMIEKAMGRISDLLNY
jgi:uridine phosphorylase